MKAISHWSLGYLYDRAREIIYRKTHPEQPWLTRAANDFLRSFLRSSDIGLEAGAGRSTVFFAQRVGRLISVEHDVDWHRRVSEWLHYKGFKNVELHLAQCDPRLKDAAASSSEYVKIISNQPPASLDFVLVDGVYRGACALASIRALKPGGILIIDDANRYLSSESRAPDSLPAGGEPPSERWREVKGVLTPWRCFWTTDGVADTAIFFAPC